MRIFKSKYEHAFTKYVSYRYISAMIDFEMPRNRYMHPTRSKAWEWNNLEFPIVINLVCKEVNGFNLIICNIYPIGFVPFNWFI